MRVRLPSSHRLRLALAIAVLVGTLFVLAAGMFLLGFRMALDNLHLQRISPDDAATAMANDEFYSDYNESTLLVHGSVASVSGAIVVFATHGAGASCQMEAGSLAVTDGTTITVLTEGARAIRDGNGVILTGCTLVFDG